MQYYEESLGQVGTRTNWSQKNGSLLIEFGKMGTGRKR